jgi:predicted AAA+ superfamily ATPase
LGARQVGKTTLLKKIIAKNKNVKVINGDEPDAIEQLSDLSSDRMQTNFGTTKTLIIDEAQMIPDIGIILKCIADYIDDVQLFVSGSSSLELANSVNEPLAGRKIEYNIFPLSFKEMVNHTSFIEEKNGMFSAYEFKQNNKKRARFSKTFTEAYPVKATATISPGNIEEFLL